MPSRHSVPTLAELVQDPTRASDTPPGIIPAFLSQIAAVQGALSAQLIRAFAREQAEEDTRRADRLLTAAAAAARLAVTKYWLYEHARQLPFTVRIGRRGVRFSEKGIERYLRQRQGVQ